MQYIDTSSTRLFFRRLINQLHVIMLLCSVLYTNVNADTKSEVKIVKKKTSSAKKKKNDVVKVKESKVEQKIAELSKETTKNLAATNQAAPQNVLQLPRFATLRAKKVNLHVGPGVNFPVSWLLLRPGMPVEIIAEFDTWRQIRDWQGTEGWVHKSLLMGKRSFWTLHKTQELKASPDVSAKTIAYVQANVIGRLFECQAQWCKVEVVATEALAKGHPYKGWLPRQAIWGVYPHENKF